VQFILEEHREAREGVLATAIALRARVRAGVDGGGHAVHPGRGVQALAVSVLSTDHVLHRLNDVENLTPRHSLLAPIRDMGAHVRFVPTRSPYQ